jgi:hypothetical protein
MKKRLRVVLLLSLVTLVLPLSPALAADFPLSPDDTVVADGLDYLRDAQGADGNIGGYSVSAWAVTAIAAAGEDPHQWGDPSIVDYLRDNSDQLDWDKATDLERAILAIAAAGEDPSDFGGEDYVAALKSLYDGEQIGYADTVNDDYWGILALIAAGESPSSVIIGNTASFIINVQNEDGGWNWEVYGESDVDDTAAAIMALVAAGDPDPDVIDMALLFLMDMQNDDGGFPSLYGAESNSASDAWAIGALVAAGENMADWVGVGGDDPVDNLISLQDSDGSFKKTAGQAANPEFMTAYAIPALLGDPYPVMPFQGSPPPEADLIVDDIDVPSVIYVGEEVVVTATVKNIGGEGITDSFRVRLYADNDTIDTVAVGELDAGDSVEVDLEWTPDAAGDYTLEVVVDLDDDIDESSESNNDDTLDVEVEEPPQEADLVVDGIDVPSAIYVGEEVVVTATLKNIGGEDITDSFRVRLYADNDTIDTVTVDELDTGDSVEVDLEWTPDEVGDYTLEVVVDLDNDIDEARENNNDDTLDVEVMVITASSSSPQEESPTTPLAISARVEPGQIDFGELVSGETSTSYMVTVVNNGNSDILVTAEVAGSAQGFYVATLKLDGKPWDEFSVLVAKQSSRGIRVSLDVPHSYSGEVLEDGVLTFWTTLSP